MLKITDLTASKEMDRKEMSAVRGGESPFIGLDFSTGIFNDVADVTQAFEFNFAQANRGAVTNNQEIHGGNGSSSSPVDQRQVQTNWMDVRGVGNTFVD